MEFTYGFFIFSTLLALPFLLLLTRKNRKTGSNQHPPGPPGWPVVGNIFDLGTMPHQNLYKLRDTYGPVLWLKLGSVNTMAVQSAMAATELFKNHDVNFCDRKVPGAMTAHSYNEGSMALGRYGLYWRILRRLSSMELLVNKRINETAPVRRKVVNDLIRNIEVVAATSRDRGESGVVNMPHILFLMAFNLIGNLVLSRDLLDANSEKGQEFSDAMNNVMKWAGTPNLADFFPFLKWLDPQGIQNNMVRDMGRTMNIIAGFVKERMEERKLGNANLKKDFLDALLDYDGSEKEGPDKISDQNIKVFVLEMFFAGSETTSSTIEWAMSELLCNPEVMKKAKEELDGVVGKQRKLEESDIDNLPYLQAIVKETLRLHPAIPLLLPRNAMQDTHYMGYFIPKDTQILVNAWAIGRDPDVWKEPLSFKPERFVGSNVDYKGQNFELIPFGSGRRICVGISLAHRVVHLALGSLIHGFEWELGKGNGEAMDMNERMGITMRKLVPLKAIAKKIMV